jgi:hypothetical protein
MDLFDNGYYCSHKSVNDEEWLKHDKWNSVNETTRWMVQMEDMNTVTARECTNAECSGEGGISGRWEIIFTEELRITLDDGTRFLAPFDAGNCEQTLAGFV